MSSKLPARVWIVTNLVTGKQSFYESKPSMFLPNDFSGEYIRADLVEGLVEALEVYSKGPEWHEVDDMMNLCADYCPKDCTAHSMSYRRKAKGVAHGEQIATEAPTAYRREMEGK